MGPRAGAGPARTAPPPPASQHGRCTLALGYHYPVFLRVSLVVLASKHVTVIPQCLTMISVEGGEEGKDELAPSRLHGCVRSIVSSGTSAVSAAVMQVACLLPLRLLGISRM